MLEHPPHVSFSYFPSSSTLLTFLFHKHSPFLSHHVPHQQPEVVPLFENHCSAVASLLCRRIRHLGPHRQCLCPLAWHQHLQLCQQPKVPWQWSVPSSPSVFHSHSNLFPCPSFSLTYTSNLSTSFCHHTLNSIIALHHNNDTNMGPEEEDRMIKASLIIFGALFALTNAVALYGAVRRSVAATKASLIIWIIQMSWWAVAMVFMVIGFMGLPDSDRDQIPRPSGGDMAVLAGSVWLTLFHGWSLLVYLRDLRSRQRNVWGFLVKPGVQGVFEYEPLGTSSGPVHL
ncbi:hypothetical protein BKA57DRAFT_447890 [Linnemannia elongata]|nr:hypothetical protein BKA57DRAFT_447890 [Linnemannia elongata]